MVEARLLRAWRATRFEACGAEAQPGRRSPAVDALLARLGVRQGGFLGAWNPWARRVGAGVNRRAEARLLAAVRRLPQAAGHGRGRGWAEAHLLLGADPRRVAVLARRFRQAGWLWLRRGQPARLVILRRN